MRRNNLSVAFLTLLAVLAAFALYRSEFAYQHRNLMEAFVLMVIAMMFIRRVQQKS